MPNAILALNAGSSSIKFGLYEYGISAQRLMLRGLIDGIGTEPHFLACAPDGTPLGEYRWKDGKRQDHEALLKPLLDWIAAHLGEESLIAVGHRVVHGGGRYRQPVCVDDGMLTELEKLIPLAPLQQPHNLAAIRAVGSLCPGLRQVACFDTAFHSHMPPVATRLALPRAFMKEGVRRYGFHGLSYEYLISRLRELAPALATGRIIAAHLGNGASLCAMRDGHSIETTMSFTTLDGLVMGTRCGSIDPGLLLYLQQVHGLSAGDVENLLYHESGLLGLSGISSDMRTLVSSQDPHAKEAIELFVYRIVREIGALASSLGGLDGLVFSAGIGEHMPTIRAAVCEGLAWLGVECDAEANARHDTLISTSHSRVHVCVIRTDEEAMIAAHTAQALRNSTPRPETAPAFPRICSMSGVSP
jgi:acetate kinase